MNGFSRENITIIGGGKIACSFTAALINAGFKINSVISRSSRSAEQLAKKFTIQFHSNDLKRLHAEGIFFLSVPDDQIKPLAKKISLLNMNFRKSLFVHLSGALNTSHLSYLKKKGAFTASLHIMQTFPSKKIQNIKGCHAALETYDAAVKNFLFELCSKLGLKAFSLEGDKKIHYHLAGVFASNFLVGNIYSSGRLLGKTKIKNEPEEIFRVIINSTLNNINKLGSAHALLGPVDRGDYKTVQNHIAALKKYKGKKKINDLLVSYLSQSLSLLNIVKEKTAKLNSGHKKIKSMLKRELNTVYKSELIN